MKKSLSLLILSLSSPVFPNALQYFAGISYNNPAELVKVKSHEYILGTVGFDLKGKFTGESLNFNTLQYESELQKTIRKIYCPTAVLQKD
jgi:long-chain fatty acid transport protein